MFIDDNAQRVQAASESVVRDDPAALRGAVHAIKGSAGLIGAIRLHDLAAELELALVKRRASNLPEAVEELRLEYTAVVRTLRTKYPQLSSPNGRIGESLTQ
ncbi:MAG TPA: Hpt domain-containing protein [Vicinamibacterales bacterium]|nr:Hpt domain-containing protein [Vicinamibacterales bacterium]